MKPPRLTVRWLMVAVAVFAVAFGCVRWVEARRSRFRAILEDQDRIWKDISMEIRRCEQDGPPPTRAEEAVLEAKITYFQEMKRIYESAVRYPWLPVEPEPPKPQ